MNSLIEAIRTHWFWAAMTLAVVAWYSVITLYVAVRGGVDIRNMLGRLKNSDPSCPAKPDGQQPT